MAKKKKTENDPLREAMEGDFPEAFRMEEAGTMLVGKVTGFSVGYSKYGPHPVVIIQNEDDGEIVSVHCLHAALRNQMMEADPKPGDRIAVKYIGEEEAKSGKRKGEKYKNFRVRIDAATRSFADVMAGVARKSRDDEEGDDDLPF